MNKPIYVTQPSLAPLEEFNEYLQQIWDSGVMTHNGPLLQRLEREISTYENVPDTVCVANGTCAMQLAIRALDLEGEIITTPFTFIATANVISWERCKPVFVDIDLDTWNINPVKIEEAITNKTVAIMPVHVFSAPCDVLRIQQIADKYRLKIIYDAAHAMCVKIKDKSIMTYGDISCSSFHATKLFNTCEGGGCFTENRDLAARIRRMRFFGFDEKKEILDVGMNAKMTEMTAGLGLANLRHLDEVRKNRREKYELYQALLGDCNYIEFQKFDPAEYNYSYMPILFDTEERLLKTLEKLAEENIFPRRYFYPALHNLDVFESIALPIAESVASRIVCMPLYDKLSRADIENICNLITNL
jgi:dTDP-4-amino-4,6-dideoxygalactose transaminase